MPTWMDDINKNSPGCSLRGIFPEEWNNIALPIVDTLILMLKEIYRLDLKTDDLGKSSNTLKQKQVDNYKQSNRNIESVKQNTKHDLDYNQKKMTKTMEEKFTNLIADIGKMDKDIRKEIGEEFQTKINIAINNSNLKMEKQITS